MEIDAYAFIKVFENNFKYEIVDTPLGKGVKMDCYSAFVFSCVTGYGYLENHILPYSPKPQIKIFYNALEYKFVTGLFNKTSLYNTPYNISLSKPYIFSGDKIIVPIEFEKDIILQKQLRTFISENKNHKDYIIARIETSKKGNGMEPFMEYLTCEYFQKYGYIVENQIPLSHSEGTPDFGGFKLLVNRDSKYQLNSINIIQLAMIRIKKTVENYKHLDDLDFIVGEAKTSTLAMKKQLYKYIKTGYFNKAFEIHPSKSTPDDDSFGLISIDKSYKLLKVDSKQKLLAVNKIKQQQYNDWLIIYKKLYLLSNLTNDEFNEYHLETMHKQMSSDIDIIEFAKYLTIDDIVDKIMETI